MAKDEVKEKFSASESLVKAFVTVLENVDVQEQFDKASRRSAESLGSKSLKYYS